MEQSTTALKSRGGFLVAALLLLLGLMGGRFFQIMVLRHDELRLRATRQMTRTETVRAYRGAILDRHGRELALTRLVPSVAVDPGLVEPEEREPLARALADGLGLEIAAVRKHLGKTGSRFRWLRRQVLDEEAIEGVRALGHRAIIIRDELCRIHPAGALAAHLVGMTDADGTGIAGIEQVCQKTLAPCFGERVVHRDGTTSCRRITAPDGEVRPGSDGEDVVLALDLTIQSFAEEALDKAVEKWQPESAVVVVMDPRNGDVLALVNRPTFHPDHRQGLPRHATRMGAVADAYEVGSTMKPLIAAAALDAGVVSPHETFDCTTSGRYRIGRSRILEDHKPLGLRPFPEVIIHSSNIGMAKIVARLGIDRTYNHVRALGFGAKAGTGLPCEGKGLVHPRGKWTEVWSLPSIAMGHEIMVTPIQFATAFSALVSGGVLHRPRIVLSVGGRKIEPRPVRQVISRETAEEIMVPILVRVVDEGTGRKARVEGYRVGGKTGTARVLDKHRNVIGYTSSFVGFGPAEDPRFLVFALLSRPRRDLGVTPYGGSTAGPVVGELLARCLRYAEIAPTVTMPPVPRRIDERPSRTHVPSPAPASSTGRSNREIDLRQIRMRKEGGH